MQGKFLVKEEIMFKRKVDDGQHMMTIEALQRFSGELKAAHAFFRNDSVLYRNLFLFSDAAEAFTILVSKLCKFIWTFSCLASFVKIRNSN